MKNTKEEKLKFWTKHLSSCAKSGDNVARYCREHGLSVAQFSYWHTKLSSLKSQAPQTIPSSGGFSRLCAVAEEPRAMPIRVRIVEFELPQVSDLASLFSRGRF
jgi:transposase-like protein